MADSRAGNENRISGSVVRAFFDINPTYDIIYFCNGKFYLFTHLFIHLYALCSWSL